MNPLHRSFSNDPLALKLGRLRIVANKTLPGVHVDDVVLYADIGAALVDREAHMLVVDRLAALRSDAGFATAVSFLPELGALVDQADAVLAGKPFDERGYAGGG